MSTVVNFNLRNIALALVLIGLIVSGYLSYTKLTNTEILCPTGEESAFDCDAVGNSVYAEFPPRSGISVAWLGFGVYLLIGGIILFEKRIPFLVDWSIPLVFGIVLFSFLFSMYLVYVQAAIINKFCVWCLAHEITMTALFVVYIMRLILFLNKPSESES